MSKRMGPKLRPMAEAVKTPGADQLRKALRAGPEAVMPRGTVDVGRLPGSILGKAVKHINQPSKLGFKRSQGDG